MKFEIQNGELLSYLPWRKEKRVKIPANVTKIAPRVFAKQEHLETVILPDGLTEIGEEAFDGCTNLREIPFPASLTKIGRFAFAWCRSLKQVQFPADSRLTQLGDFAFGYCLGIQELILPDSLTEIGENAFFICASTRKIRIPAKLEKAPLSREWKCRDLQEIDCPVFPEQGSASYRWLCHIIGCNPGTAKKMYRENRLTEDMAHLVMQAASEYDHADLTALMLQYFHEHPDSGSGDMTL